MIVVIAAFEIELETDFNLYFLWNHLSLADFKQNIGFLIQVVFLGANDDIFESIELNFAIIRYV